MHTHTADRHRRWDGAGLFAACLLLIHGHAAGQAHEADAPGHAEPATALAVSPDQARAWQADLDELAHELEVRHGEPFNTISREDFRASVEALRARIPELARHEIIVEMQRIVATIGDGHTSMPLLFDAAVGFHALPLRLGWYEEGIFVEAGAESLGDLIGARLLAVGGIPIEEAIERVTPLVSRDNEIWIRVMAPAYLRMTEILHATGLSSDPMSASLRFDRDGSVRTVTVDALEEPLVVSHGPQPPPVPDWMEHAESGPGEPPLYRRHPERAYWREYLPEHRTLYVQYNQVNNAPHGPGVEAFFAETLRFVDENPVERLVLDIRHNGGGEGNLNYAVVRGILRRPEIDRAGGLFVIIGRGTFSAAQVLAHWLDRWTNAEFVGEPTGSSPQFWGDRRSFRLGNSGLLAGASPTWWQPGGPYDRRPYLPPVLAFEPRWADYVANRDPALQAILAWDERTGLEEGVLDALQDEPRAPEANPAPRARAASLVREWSADPAHRYRNATTELNRLGYRLLGENRGDLALAIFRLNVEVHPDYANGWDSLGETLLARGQREAGLEAYRRAFELDPEVGRAAEVLGHERGEPPVNADEDIEPALRLLHSFAYDRARTAFRRIRTSAPDRVMAYWGEAMTHTDPIGRGTDLEAARSVLRGLGTSDEARLARATTERERAYLRASEALFFGDSAGIGMRYARFAVEMEEIHRRWPDDPEALAFLALGHLGSAGGVRDHDAYMRAAAVAEELFDRDPRHPGAAHYLIHAYDDPVHAPLGERAARVYADLAPDVPHALHMPSHIFLALGEWEGVIASNRRAWEVSLDRADRFPGEHPDDHAFFWLGYGLLQADRGVEGRLVLRELADHARRTDAGSAWFRLARMRAAWVADAPGAEEEAGRIHVDTTRLQGTGRAIDRWARGMIAARAGDGTALDREISVFEDQLEAVEGDAYSRLLEVLLGQLTAEEALLAADTARALERLRAAAEAERDMRVAFGPPLQPRLAAERLAALYLATARTEEAGIWMAEAARRAPGRRFLRLLGPPLR